MHERVGLIFLAVCILLSSRANAVSADSMRIPETNKAIVLDPFNYEFSRLLSYDLFIRSIIYNLQRAGYTVDYRKDSNVTMDLLKRLDNEGYGVIYINTHGFTDSEGRVLFFTGEKNTSGAEGLCQMDIEEKRIGCFEQEGYLTGYFYVAPEFFAFYGNDTRYHNALIFTDACHSANNTSMAKVFLDLDAGCYVGWTELVGVEHGVAMDGKFFNTMCVDGETVEKSVRTIRPDPIGRAELVYFGDGSLCLIDAPLNPKTEGVPTWVTVAELAVVILLAVSIAYKISRIVAHNRQKSHMYDDKPSPHTWRVKIHPVRVIRLNSPTARGVHASRHKPTPDSQEERSKELMGSMDRPGTDRRFQMWSNSGATNMAPSYVSCPVTP